MLKANYPKGMMAKMVKSKKPKKMKVKMASSSKIQSGQGPYKGSKKSKVPYC